jgi:hypothetical protein
VRFLLQNCWLNITEPLHTKSKNFTMNHLKKLKLLTPSFMETMGRLLYKYTAQMNFCISSFTYPCKWAFSTEQSSFWWYYVLTRDKGNYCMTILWYREWLIRDSWFGRGLSYEWGEWDLKSVMRIKLQHLDVRSVKQLSQ